MNVSAAGAATLFIFASTACTYLFSQPQIIYNGDVITIPSNMPSGCLPISMQENEPITGGTASGSNYQHIFMTQNITQGTSGTAGLYIDSAHWSNIPGETHAIDNCPDQTYHICNSEGKIVSGIYNTKEEAKQVLDNYLRSIHY